MATWLDTEWARNPFPTQLVLDPRYGGVDLGDLPPSPLTDIACRYLADFRNFASRGMAPAFYGPAERGKSETAAAIARRVNLVGRLEVEWVNIPRLKVQLALQKFKQATATAITRYAAVPFLVMDDIHLVQPGSDLATVFDHLISARFDTLRPTLCTGNFSFPGDPYTALGDRFGPMVARRLRDGAKGLTAVITT